MTIVIASLFSALPRTWLTKDALLINPERDEADIPNTRLPSLEVEKVLIPVHHESPGY